jgi:hypothetical protein
MGKPQFPDLIYPVTKIYEGINRQDYAELSLGLVGRIREDLQNYRPQISTSVDQIGYNGILESVVRELDELEKYFQDFHNHKKPRISKKSAEKIQASLIKQVNALEQLSKR